ncbi:MAG: DUF424 family protein [Candidatus Bathyarchaeota archaeon]
MEVSINIIKQGKHVLVAACDLDLLGKTLKFGKIDFEIRSNFYGGSVVNVEEAVNLMKHGTSVNLVGSVIVKRAIEAGLIHPQAVLKISGIPHAQIIKL